MIKVGDYIIYTNGDEVLRTILEESYRSVVRQLGGIRMSYDLAIHVKVEGCDKYAQIAEPELCNPTYNLRKLFVACMEWDYSVQCEDVNGKWHKCYYPCDFVIEKVEHGIKELRTNRKAYEQYEPENGWGTIGNAINVLESLRSCIYEQAEEIPLNCLYMSW